MVNRFILFSLAVLISFPGGTSAVTERELNWPDLVKKIEFEDPFKKLTSDQIVHLSRYARLQEVQKSSPERVSEAMRQEANEAERSLRNEGVDIEGLLARRQEIKELRTQQAFAVVPELNGQTIRMPGFVLPLEYAGKKVTEFLLVPWVGACIHTPPPPANQIVHVVVDENMARESTGLFEPVSVTGTMFTENVSKSLYLVDGSSDINVGYTMQANMVEPYVNKKEQNSKTQLQR